MEASKSIDILDKASRLIITLKENQTRLLDRYIEVQEQRNEDCSLFFLFDTPDEAVLKALADIQELRFQIESGILD